VKNQKVEEMGCLLGEFPLKDKLDKDFVKGEMEKYRKILTAQLVGEEEEETGTTAGRLTSIDCL